MTDHNARQAGLTDERIRAIHRSVSNHHIDFARAIEREVLAAHSADARNVATRQVQRYDLQAGDGPGIYEHPDNDGEWVKYADITHLLAAPAAPASTVPEGYALVPLRMNQAMEDLAQEGEWEWADMLAAAEAITEAQYNEIYGVDAAPAPAAQADTLHDVFVPWAKEKGFVLDRKPGWPDDYERTATSVAWEAFRAGYYAKGSVKTHTFTKTWQHPAMKLNRSGN